MMTTRCNKLEPLISFLIFDYYNTINTPNEKQTIIPYFEIGPLMDPEKMRRVVGEVYFLGTAVLKNFTLAFGNNPKSLYGCATVRADEGSDVYGALFLLRLDQREKIARLHRSQGLDKYIRVDIEVHHQSYKTLCVTVDVNNQVSEKSIPTSIYKEQLIRSAKKIQLPNKYVASLNNYSQQLPSRL